jgi:hypothetical protein
MVKAPPADEARGVSIRGTRQRETVSRQVRVNSRHMRCANEALRQSSQRANNPATAPDQAIAKSAGLDKKGRAHIEATMPR